MANMHLNEDQQKIRNIPFESALFIEGPAGTGKTTAAIHRLIKTLEYIPGYQTLVITPQQSLARPYRQFLLFENAQCGGIPNITTISGLMQEMVKIFWPLIRQSFAFKGQNPEPIFLSLETAQFCMSRIVEPLIEKGYFQSVKIDQHRLYSQIIDNLNKTAIHNIPLHEISKRLISGSIDPTVIGNAFKQVEECAFLFRSFCLKNNLIDFSLLTTIARQFLFLDDLPDNYIKTRYKALVADNIEEDTPLAHDFFRQFLETFSSTTLIYDHNGGFRTFLGADAEYAYQLKTQCNQHITTKDRVDKNEQIISFHHALTACIEKKKYKKEVEFNFRDHFQVSVYQFLPEMMDGITEKIADLVNSGTTPEEIAVLSPYLSDVLQFSLTQRLKRLDLPIFTSRPSRMYYSSSAIRAILTLAKLSHPDWQLSISHYEFRDCLLRLIPDLDLIRAEHIAKALLGGQPNRRNFRSFDNLTNIHLQETITFTIGQQLTQLAGWINSHLSNSIQIPLDVFIQRIFGELLSQPDFTLHSDLDAANHISRLIESIREFRFFSKAAFDFDEPDLGKIYIEQIQAGMLPVAFSTKKEKEEGIIISPAHTFLMQNQNVSYQFWLDIGSLGWWERLYQPLTNPYVYQQKWKFEEGWNEQQEYQTNQEMMAKLINGLLLRCRKGVFPSIVQTNEYGAQNAGPLLRSIQKMIKLNTRNNFGDN